MSNSSGLLLSGALMGASGVAFGAFGAHYLKERLDPLKLRSWETAAQYQIIHSLPIILASMHNQFHTAGLIIASGVGLFSGSIYGLILANGNKKLRFLGPVTPVGGILMILGWIKFAI